MARAQVLVERSAASWRSIVVSASTMTRASSELELARSPERLDQDTRSRIPCSSSRRRTARRPGRRPRAASGGGLVRAIVGDDEDAEEQRRIIRSRGSSGPSSRCPDSSSWAGITIKNFELGSVGSRLLAAGVKIAASEVASRKKKIGQDRREFNGCDQVAKPGSTRVAQLIGSRRPPR